MDKKNMKPILNTVKRMVESERLSGIEDIPVINEPPAKNKTPERSGAGLNGLKSIVSKCVKCPLCETRKNVVFGEGNPRAVLLFVGEAPGADEDEQARPFVGRAGQLLTKIIEAMGLERKDVFIANILKCRPPANRNPLPSEIAFCSPYLIEQIALIKPKVICALGKFAAQTLLNTETSITKLRGNFYEYQGIKLMPTYHPAYLLRNLGGKKEVWEDMKLVARELGIDISAKRKM